MAAKKSKKPAAKKSPVKKAPAKKSAAKKTPVKAAAKKSSAKVSAAKKSKPAKPVSAKSTKPKLQAVPRGFDKVLTPLDNRLLIALDVAANMTPGGIYIPDTAADRPSQGRVLAKGRGRRNKKGQIRPLDVEVGDSVLFSTYAGSKITVSGEELLILREDEILGIVT